MTPEQFWTRRLRFWKAAHELVNRIAWRFPRTSRVWRLNGWLAARWTEPYVAWRVAETRAGRQRMGTSVLQSLPAPDFGPRWRETPSSGPGQRDGGETGV